mgnify:CR=1 FL=1
MRKHLAIPALSLFVLAGASAPAIADSGVVYVGKPAYKYSTNSGKTVVVAPQKSKKKYQTPPKLDFETDAVWHIAAQRRQRWAAHCFRHRRRRYKTPLRREPPFKGPVRG